MTKSVSVVFTPSGKRGDFPTGTSVLAAAQSLGVDLDSVCGGRGICGRCQIDVSEGQFAKFAITSHQGNLSPFNPVEAVFSGGRPMPEGRRLGCQAKLLADTVIDVPPESQRHRQVVRKREDARPIEMDPPVRLFLVDVEEASLDDPRSDGERLCQALADSWGIEAPCLSPTLLPGLQRCIRKGDWQVTAAVLKNREVIALWPGFQDAAYGLAVDIGSTTIAAHICHLSSGDIVASTGVMNPQIRFGEDLMSRVSYAMMNENGAEQMTESVRQALNDLIAEACALGAVEPADILAACLVGNPVMHHLLLGIDPVELGGAPFAMAVSEALSLRARDLGLAINPAAEIYIPPLIAGHVGADAAAVVLSEAPQNSDEMTLLVDVGTNAELILGNRQRLLAASSPTGPAFEGAQISGGQRAANGAIERVRIDPESLEPRFRIIGSDLWSDEDRFARKARRSGVTGICGSGIIEVLAEMYLTGLITTDGVIDGSMTEKTDRVVPDDRTFAYILRRADDLGPEIRITQNDIRAIQLAKAALYAGARLLMDHMGVDELDRVVLAGAFGSHIDVKYAMILGLIPDCDLVHVTSAGNAAGSGARIALLNLAARDEIEKTVKGIEKIETALEPAFQQHFVEAMAFPHKTAPYRKLREQVALPAAAMPASSGAGEEGGRRRRRRR